MQTVYFDISTKGIYPCIHAKQGDVGRKFLAVITDAGVPYNPSENTFFTIWYDGASGRGNYSAIGDNSATSVDGNKVTVELIAQMLFDPGDGVISLTMNDSSGNQIGLWNICYSVEPVMGIDSEEATQHYTALSEVASIAIAAASEAKEAAESFETDNTLSVLGKAADAKAVGETVVNLESQIDALITDPGLSSLAASDGSSIYMFSSENELNEFVASESEKIGAYKQKKYSVLLQYSPFNSAAILTISHVLTGSGYAFFADIVDTRRHFGRFGMDGIWSGWNTINSPSEYTSGIWKIREWENGECELWATVNATANLISWTNAYYSENAVPAQSYPVTFASAPQVQATPKYGNQYIYGLLSGTTAGTETTSPAFSVWRANGTSLSIPVSVDLYVKGTLA